MGIVVSIATHNCIVWYSQHIYNVFEPCRGATHKGHNVFRPTNTIKDGVPMPHFALPSFILPPIQQLLSRNSPLLRASAIGMMSSSQIKKIRELPPVAGTRRPKAPFAPIGILTVRVMTLRGDI